MRVLFCSQSGHLPEDSGGLQWSTHELATQLIALGHEVAVLSGFSGGRLKWYLTQAGLLVQGKNFTTHRYGDYDIFSARSALNITQSVAAAFRPDVAVIQGKLTIPIAQSMKAAGIATVIYIRDVAFEEQTGFERLPYSADMFVSNSEFTAKTAFERFGLRSEVIVPTMDPAEYEVESTHEAVVFINPVAKKGVSIALEVAALCRELPFLFVEGWTLTNSMLRQLQVQLKPLANVTLLRKTRNMRSIYGRAKIVLAPSIWEEAWGRVASEAQISGIPVIGSQRGGLPEAIGPGGIIIDIAEPAERWALTLRELWNDSDLYSRYSESARAYSKRPEMDPKRQARTLDRILTEAVDRNRR